MIPKLEFTAESWQEEYRAQATETLDKEFTLLRALPFAGRTCRTRETSRTFDFQEGNA